MNRRVFSVFSLAVLITGCESTSTRVRSYSDPAVGNRVIASLAILPVRNAPIAQSESIRMNREITQTVQRQNPNLRIVGPVESIQALNAKNLVADYDNYLVGLAQSGIPNSEVLHRVGEALGVDAIMQGQIVGLYQEEGSYPGRPGRTKFALRYSIVSTQDALLMWETSAEVNRRTGTVFEQAPALELVLPDATQIVLKSIPKFAFVKAGQ
jgi:hypothetical protein